MKTTLTILLIFFSLNTQAGKFGTWLGHYAKANAPSLLCSFGAGLWSGQMDALQFHYCSVKRELNPPDQWFDPCKSWTNKYQDHQPPKEAFPLSTTALVCFTDQWHFAQFQRDALVACAIAFHLGERQKWYFYILDIVVYSVAYLVGKNISYELYSLRK